MNKFLLYIVCVCLILRLMNLYIPEVNAEWKESTYKLQKQIVDLGMKKVHATQIINICKDQAKDPLHCVRTAVFISKAESNLGTASTNMFGFTDGQYPTHNKAIKRWIKSYIKYWHKTSGPGDFYSNSKKKPKTWYCLSEHQPNGTVLPYCKNGLKNATYIYNKFKNENK